MAVYYVDVTNVNNAGDGLTPQTAALSEEKLDLNPGDTVLFKRGTTMRKAFVTVSGTKENSITYGAYGEGEKPIFCGSLDMTDEAMWKEDGENIWVCDSFPYEACNLIFDGGESFGVLRWNVEDMCEQGDFFDNCFGYTQKFLPIPREHKIYMYSKGNPALVYSSIECAIVYKRTHTNNLPNINIQNLKFLNHGMHCIAGDAKSENIRIQNCEFVNVGGCVWNAERRIRFGNAVEFWNHAENISITHCLFDNIYDSATSHQGNASCERGRNIHIDDNVFIRVGMGAYELRDRIPQDSSFSRNICVDAGDGFSKLGIEMPRNSEIWPRPMGHHIFMWRVEEEKEGVFEVKDNIFYNAPYGAMVYSIINPECEKLISFEGNTYYTENKDLAMRIHGKDYRDFKDYAPFEKGCKYEKTDVYALIEDWKKRS